eukprot:gene3696-6510_t
MDFPSRIHKLNNFSCTNKIQILVIIQEASEFSFQYSLNSKDDIIKDQNNHKWLPQIPITLNFKREDIYTHYPLEKVNSFRNIFENSETFRINCIQFNDVNKKCCPKNTFESTIHFIDYNTTEYEYFQIKQPYIDFKMNIKATQGDVEKYMILNPTKKQDTISGMKSEIQFTIDNLVQFSSYEYLVFEKDKMTTDLLIPKIFFSPTVSKTNIFNMKNEDFLNEKNCNLPIGYLVEISNGSPYNQLSSFKKKMKYYLQCPLNETRSSISEYPNLVFKCDDVGLLTLIVELTVDNDNFKLIKMIGIPKILDSGILPYLYNEIYVIIFIDIMNIGDNGGNFEIQPKICCIKSNCDILKLSRSKFKFIDSITTERISFYVSSEKILNKEGYCDFDIVQDGKIEISHRVILNNKATTTTTTTNQNNCSYDCIDDNPCTYDQEYISSKCYFVNCEIKYKGYRNYSNSNTGYCESIQICDLNSQSYDSIQNKCINLLIPIKIICGNHGIISEDKTTCICDDGWTTDYDQNDYQNFKFCTVYQPTNIQYNTTTTNFIFSKEFVIKNYSKSI